MLERIYKFTAEVIETVPSYETFPMFDEYGKLVGAFARLRGDYVKGWVSGKESPVALRVSTGESFWFTPKLGKDGTVSHAIVSEHSFGAMSVQVTMAEEENMLRAEALDEKTT